MANIVLGISNNGKLWYYTPGLKEFKSYRTQEYASFVVNYSDSELLVNFFLSLVRITSFVISSFRYVEIILNF